MKIECTANTLSCYNYLFSFGQVLLQWHMRKYDCRIKVFVNRLLEWQKAGYVSVDVWTEIKRLVKENVLPSDHDITSDSMSSADDTTEVNAVVNLESLSTNKTEPDNILSEVHMPKCFLSVKRKEIHNY